MYKLLPKYEAEIWNANEEVWMTGFDVFGDYIYAENYEEAFWVVEDWLRDHCDCDETDELAVARRDNFLKNAETHIRKYRDSEEAEEDEWVCNIEEAKERDKKNKYKKMADLAEEWLSFVFSGTRLQSRDRDSNAWFVDGADVCIAINDTKYSFSGNYCDMDDVENVKCYICDTDISVYAIDKEGHECALFIIEGDMTEIDSVDDVFGF